MSTLSNQQINQSYQGLIKLADSSSGITTSLQSIQDGLGNDTGMKMGLNFFTAPSLISFKPLGKATGGPGIAIGAGTVFPVGSQDKIFGTFFLDEGINSYTGITFRVGTVTSTSDVMNFAFYTLEQTNQFGLAPKDLIMSGLTLSGSDLTSTGLITKALPSTLTLPYPGPFALLWYTTNANVQPTVRLTAPADPASQTSLMGLMYGYIVSVDGTAAQNPWYGANSEGGSIYYSTTSSPFVTSYDPPTIAATASSAIIGSAGFILRK